MRTLRLIALCLLVSAVLPAQAPAPAGGPPAAPPDQAPAAAPAPTAGAEDTLEEMVKDELQGSDASYRYDPRGRRDPFRSLLQYQTKGPENCQQGTVGCLLWDEISLQGIWKVRGAFVSQILAKNGDVYWIKDGDALFDGQVTRIGIDCIYFKQKVNDPTKINPFRDVEKCLAP
jgi:hypothetical protein